MRAIAWTSILALIISVITACGGGGDGSGDSGGQSAASCNAMRELKSYRYRIAINLQSPAFQASGGASPAPPLTAFADTLTALLSNFAIDGAHIAPDRTQAILKFEQDEIEVRAIGRRSWVSVGGAFEERKSAEDAALLTPEVVCKDIVEGMAESLSGVDARDESVNGVESKHYTLSEADLDLLPTLIGAGSDAELPKKFQVDLWLAEQGRWPVRLVIGAQDTDAQGRPIGLNVSMDVRDVNDAGISIEPPLTSIGS